MGMVKHFKDLTVWQKADTLAHQTFDVAEAFPKRYLFDLTSQLRRAALSVPANIVEGSASIHTGELLQSINVARRSVRETQYFLRFALQRELITTVQFEALDAGYEEVFRMLNGLTRALKDAKVRGE